MKIKTAMRQKNGCELHDRMVEITANEQNKKKKRMKRNEDRFRDLWNNTKYTNIQIKVVLEK